MVLGDFVLVEKHRFPSFLSRGGVAMATRLLGAVSAYPKTNSPRNVSARGEHGLFRTFGYPTTSLVLGPGRCEPHCCILHYNGLPIEASPITGPVKHKHTSISDPPAIPVLPSYTGTLRIFSTTRFSCPMGTAILPGDLLLAYRVFLAVYKAEPITYSSRAYFYTCTKETGAHLGTHLPLSGRHFIPLGAGLPLWFLPLPSQHHHHYMHISDYPASLPRPLPRPRPPLVTSSSPPAEPLALS